MEVFKLDLVLLMHLFYPIMAVVVSIGVAGNWWLALLALNIFLSAMVVVKYSRNKEKI